MKFYLIRMNDNGVISYVYKACSGFTRYTDHMKYAQQYFDLRKAQKATVLSRNKLSTTHKSSTLLLPTLEIVEYSVVEDNVVPF